MVLHLIDLIYFLMYRGFSLAVYRGTVKDSFYYHIALLFIFLIILSV